MNDFVDIFNGKKGYGCLLRRCFATPPPPRPCIRRVRIVTTLATFTPPYPKLPRPCMTLFFLFEWFLVSIPCVTSTR